MFLGFRYSCAVARIIITRRQMPCFLKIFKEYILAYAVRSRAVLEVLMHCS